MAIRVIVMEKLVWIRSHAFSSLLVSGCGLLLMIPKVQKMVVFFWPLLLSTALLFFTALLSLDKLKQQTTHQDTLITPEEHDAIINSCCDPSSSHSFSNETDEEEENDGSNQREIPERSRLDCVAEQNEGALLHFDSFVNRSIESEVGKTLR